MREDDGVVVDKGEEGIRALEKKVGQRAIYHLHGHRVA